MSEIWKLRLMIITACGGMYITSAWLFWVSWYLVGVIVAIIAVIWTYDGIKDWRSLTQ